MHLKNCDRAEFIKRIQDKRLICFGAGSLILETEFEVQTIPQLEDYIDCFIDNNPAKWGKQIRVRGKEFMIYPSVFLKKQDHCDIVILITCMAYQEIIGQLQKIPELNDTDCYLYSCIITAPQLQVAHFFEYEIHKKAFAEYYEILKSLQLKDKYKNRRCFIIGNGPSLAPEDLELLKDEITFASNRIFLMFPKTSWRPTYYFCIDHLICAMDIDIISNIECANKFVPLVCALTNGKVCDSLTYYKRELNYTKATEDGVMYDTAFCFSNDISQVVYGGQSVTYDMLQFALYMGFNQVYLIGMDHTFSKEIRQDGMIMNNQTQKNHFSEEYDKKLEQNVAVVAPLYAVTAAFEIAKASFEQSGKKIYNSTRGGKLEVFERKSLTDVLSKKE